MSAILSNPGDAWAEHMRSGDFEAAWRVSDAVLHSRANAPRHTGPRHWQNIWDGTPLAGRRVLVRCYHGLGDTVQFARYLPLVRAIAREVIVWAPEPLLPLLRTVGGIDQLLPLHDGTPDARYDVDVELMELPHVFRTTLDTLPAFVPYLHVAPAADLPRGDALAIGLVWQSGAWDARRDVPATVLAPLARIPGVQLHLLQRGPARDAWPFPGAIDSSDDDPLRLAAVMRALDLVISVDSFPAHLAGALAVPVWTLLPAEADWRWLRDRADAPWYPTMRLFRQPRPGDWPAVIENVCAALARVVAGS